MGCAFLSLHNLKGRGDGHMKFLTTLCHSQCTIFKCYTFKQPASQNTTRKHNINWEQEPLSILKHFMK